MCCAVLTQLRKNVHRIAGRTEKHIGSPAEKKNNKRQGRRGKSENNRERTRKERVVDGIDYKAKEQGKRKT